MTTLKLIDCKKINNVNEVIEWAKRELDIVKTRNPENIAIAYTFKGGSAFMFRGGNTTGLIGALEILKQHIIEEGLTNTEPTEE